MSVSAEPDWALICEAVPDPVIVIDAETHEIVRASGAVSDRFGYDPETLLGEHHTILHPKSDAERYATLLDRHGEELDLLRSFPDGSPLYVETAAGTQVPVEINASRVQSAGGELLVGVFRETTEQVALEQRLVGQRDNLKLLNEVVRHDIRNDLQLVEAYAEMLADYVDDEGTEYLEIIQESTHQAVELTKTARNLTAVMLDSESAPEPVPIATTLETQIEDIRSTYPGSVLTLEGTLPERAVVADDMLGVVFRNLLKNAIQHNDARVPQVAVSVTIDKPRLQVRVADNGPGVPEGHKEEIFGKGELGLESNGSGIGLYLVQYLVDGYDGTVWIEDNEPTGAVFAVELPLAD